MPMQDVVQFKKYLDSLTKEEREQLLQDLYRDYEGEEDVLATEQDYAEQLRDTPDPGMRNVGRFTVAANPLEFAGAGIDRYQGQQLADRIRQQRGELSTGRTRGLQGVAQMLLGGGGAPAAPPAAVNPYLAALRNQPPLI